MADRPKSKTIAIDMDRRLHERVKKRLSVTEFRTVDEYVNYVVKEVLDQLEKEGPAYSQEDEKKVKERLKALGYMD